MKMYELTCPKCGAHMEVHESKTKAVCPYCNYTVLIENETNPKENENQAKNDFPIDCPAVEFHKICKQVAKRYSEIENVNIVGSTVICYVTSDHNSRWKFSLAIDFHKKTYNLQSEKRLSKLPKVFSKSVLKEIEAFRKEYTKEWNETDCPNCKARMVQRNREDDWICNDCGCILPANAFSEDSDYILWFCDKCGAFLNFQEGFSTKDKEWPCIACGFKNKVDPNDDSIISD